MDQLAVTGDSVLLQPPPGCVWQGWDGKLRIEGLQCLKRITADGQPVALEADLPMAALLAAGKPYISPPFVTPGTILVVQLTVIPPTLSMSVTANGQKVITAGTKGTYTMSVVPAMQPSAPSPIPDPLVSKVGQWSIVTSTQSKAASGMPMPVPKTGDDGEGGAGGAGGGAGGSSESESDDKDHFVAVTIEDTDGNKLAGQFASITLPTGERVKRELNPGGAARIDGIKKEGDGEATVNLVFDPSLTPVVDDSKGNFIALEIIDEQGNPIAEHVVNIAIDGLDPIDSILNGKGRTRVDGVKPDLDATVTLGGEAELGEGDGASDGEGGGQDSVDEDGGASDEAGSGLGGDDTQTSSGDSAEGGSAVPEEEAAVAQTQVTLQDADGQPLPNYRVAVTVGAGAEPIELASDDAGVLSVPAGEGEEFTLSISE